MSGHTPEPWTARKHTDTAGWTVSAGSSVASVRPRPEAEANAHLIAAAPELLAALKRVVAGFWADTQERERETFRHNYPDHGVVQAEAAIAKAEPR